MCRCHPEIRLADKALGPASGSCCSAPSSSPAPPPPPAPAAAAPCRPPPSAFPVSPARISATSSPTPVTKVGSESTLLNGSLEKPRQEQEHQYWLQDKSNRRSLCQSSNQEYCVQKHQYGLPDTRLPAVLEPVQQLHQLLEPDNDPSSLVHPTTDHLDSLVGLSLADHHRVRALVAALLPLVQPVVGVNFADFQT